MLRRRIIIFSFTILLILVALYLHLWVLLINVSLVGSEEYLLEDLDGEGDRSIDLQVGCTFFYVLLDDHIVYVKARGVLLQICGVPRIAHNWAFEVLN